MTAPSPGPALERGIHPLHLLLLIATAVLAFPLVVYLIFILAFMLLPGGMD